MAIEGVYTVGPGGYYADWIAAKADIISLGAQLSGDLTLVQIGPIALTALAEFVVDLKGFTFKITSAVPHKGHPNSGMVTTVDALDDLFQFVFISDSVGGGVLDVGDLYLKRLSNGQASSALIRQSKSNSDVYSVKFHDLLLVGGGFTGDGIRFTTEYVTHIWNVKATGFSVGGGSGIVAVDQELHQADFVIENCTAHGNFIGIQGTGAAEGTFNNNVAFNNNYDMPVYVGTPGSGNATQDTTGGDFLGTGNLYSQADVSDDFESLLLTGMWLRLKADAALLMTGGVAPVIPENTVGSEGNARPGPSGLYSRGADEIKPIFPSQWLARARVTIDPTWVDSALDAPLLLPSTAHGLPALFKTLTKAYGEDIRITTDAEGTTLIPFEVFRYGAGVDEYSIWFKASLSDTELTHLYVWWGCASAVQLPRAAIGSFLGSELVWEDYGVVYHMGNREDSILWTEDSGAHQGHTSLGSGITGWIDNPNGEGKLLEMSYGSPIVLVPAHAGDQVLRNIAAFAVTATIIPNAGAHTDTLLEALLGGNQRVLFQTASQLLKLSAEAPDGSSAQVVDGVTSIDSTPHLVSARCSIANDRMVAYLDGAVDKDQAVAFTPGLLDNTATTINIGTDNPLSFPFLGEFGEVRVYEAEATDAWFKLVHENLKAASSLFTGPYSGGDCMNGVRNFTFNVAGSGPFKLDNTDFWLEYTNDGAGGIVLRLNGVWDKVCPATDIGLARRVELEQWVKALSEDFAGLKGTLTIDEGLASEIVLSSIMLLNIDWEVIDNNAGLLYSLEFGVNIGIAGTEVARMLVFGTEALAADNLIVAHSGRDQTQFKPVYRAAPIRIPGGPAIKSIVVSAIVQALEPGTVKQRRQQAEAVIKNWIDTHLGQEALLTIDGTGYGMAHLASVRPGTLELPEAVGFDLEFAVEYGS